MVRWLRDSFPCSQGRKRRAVPPGEEIRTLTARRGNRKGDMNDFADEGRLASYSGILPRVSDSNEPERSSRTHKRVPKLGWRALVQSALIGANRSPCLKRFPEQAEARHGAGRAIIALAREFLGIIHRTLKNWWMSEDCPNFVPAEKS